MSISRFALIALAFTLGACASSPKYVPADNADDYGHYSTRLDDNRYRIVFTGGPTTGLNTTRDYALLRAAELTLQEGYDWFEIIDRETTSTTSNGYRGRTVEPAMGFGYERAYYRERDCGLLACSAPARPRNYGYVGVTSGRSRTVHSQALEVVMGNGEMPVRGGNFYNASSVAKSLWASM